VSLKIAVNGAAGRMGKRLICLLAEDRSWQLVSATETAGHPAIGKDAGMQAGAEEIGVALTAQIQGSPDVLVDFSTPAASVERATQCAQMGTAVVVGTTGLSAQQMREMRSNVATRVPLLISPNMSVGVNALFALAEQVARALGDQWDIEIIEAHHSRKKDAPSGTAVRLAEIMCATRGWDPPETLCYGRQGTVGERPAMQIGVHAVRGGDIVGTHTILFAGRGETLELKHSATSRDIFAAGALQAARFLVGKPPGLYAMKDML